MARYTCLVNRQGEYISDPTPETVRLVLSEVFESRRDDEHPNAWLHVGDDETGPEITFDVYQNGLAILTLAANQDATPEELHQWRGVPPERASTIMTFMLAHDLQGILNVVPQL
jgi:hypothetical protein